MTSDGIHRVDRATTLFSPTLRSVALHFLATIVSVTCAVLSSGCVSTAPVSVSDSRLSQAAGATFTHTLRAMPSFGNFSFTNATVGIAAGGIAGGIATVESGKKLIAKNGILDPALSISKQLCAELSARFKLSFNEAAAVKIETVDAKEVAHAIGGKVDFVLDVQTANWGSYYLPTNWTRYRVIYAAKVRLLDARKSQIVAEGFFHWKTPDNAKHPTHDELFANNAAVLREQLEEASRAATAYFIVEVLTEKR